MYQMHLYIAIRLGYKRSFYYAIIDLFYDRNSHKVEN